jgi:hypothetical protein
MSDPLPKRTIGAGFHPAKDQQLKYKPIVALLLSGMTTQV